MSTFGGTDHKTNISDVSLGLGFIKALNPIAFQFKTSRDDATPSGSIRYGFSAQDMLALEGDNPVIINNDEPNNLKYNESSLIPVIVNAIQEQQGMIETLEATTLDPNSLITKSHSEIFTSTQTLEQNELVSINPISNGDVIRTNTDNDKTVVGVVTEKITNETDQYRVQYEGKARVKVSILNGAITSGDLLTTSATNPGTVVKATPESTVTIGLALESTTVDGVIDVMLQTNYLVASTGVGTLTSTQAQILSGFSLDVDGHLIVKGDLEIQGKLKISNDNSKGVNTVSYTHLTLPTILRV